MRNKRKKQNKTEKTMERTLMQDKWSAWIKNLDEAAHAWIRAYELFPSIVKAKPSNVLRKWVTWLGEHLHFSGCNSNYGRRCCRQPGSATLYTCLVQLYQATLKLWSGILAKNFASSFFSTLATAMHPLKVHYIALWISMSHCTMNVTSLYWSTTNGLRAWYKSLKLILKF